MAGNIKGIIVEIGGDTSGLQNALKKVNSATSSLSKELRGINSMLRLDPKNTELLAQKQTVLKENIAQTEEKLKQLKTTQDLYIKSGGNLNTPEYRNLQREIISTENKLKQLNLESSKWTQLSGKINELSSKMKSFGDTVSNVGKKVSVVSAGVATLFGTGVKYNAQIETYQTAFKTFLGSAEKAEKAIANIKKQSETSPFNTSDLIQANQMLITTGVNAEDAQKTISALGDAVALTGGSSDTLTRMASNLQQIKNVGKASAMDIRQFGMAGIDIYGVLSAYTGKTTQEVKEMEITYDDLSKALQMSASENGKYFNGQIQMAETTSGKWEKLKKTFQGVTGELSQGLMPIIGKITDKLQGLADKLHKLNPVQKEIITKIGLAVVAIGPALLIIAKLISAVGVIGGALSKLSLYIVKTQFGMTGLSRALTVLSGPVGIAIAAVGGLVAVFVHLYKTNENFRNKVQETWQNITQLFQNNVMPVIEQVKNFIGNVLNTIWSVIQQVWSVIEPFIREAFETVMNWWNGTGSEIVATVMNIINYLMIAVNWIWQKVINPIINLLVNILKPVIGTFCGYLMARVNVVLDYISAVWNTLKGVFNSIITFITGVFTGNWRKAWQGVKDVFSSIVSGLGNILKLPINYMIDIINGFIKGVNKIEVPDWVPGVGGKGINIPVIPKLAKGGIVDSPTLAMIGEGKSAEAVIPLDKTLTKYLAEALKQVNNNNNITVQFYPQKMTEAEMDNAFNYINRRFGVAY